MTEIYKNIEASIKSNEKLFAVLIDPDKIAFSTISRFIKKLSVSIVTHIFVGGSAVKEHVTHDVVIEIKKHTKLPIILFPGDIQQLTEKADALLFLSLLSGRNPEYLIGKQVKAVSKLKNNQPRSYPNRIHSC